MWQKILPMIEKDSFYIHENNALKDVRVHDHAFLELTYIVRGTVEHTLDGKVTLLTPGDYLMVDYGSMHSYRAVDESGFDNIDCLFLPRLLDPSLMSTVSMRELFQHYLLHFNMRALTEDPTRMVFHDTNGQIRALISKILAENEERTAGFTEMIRCYLLEILLLTVRGIDGAKVAAGGEGISAYISAYVAEHYADDVSLGYFAEQMNYTLPYISRRFREEMGMPFVRYLQNYRINRACRYLTVTELSVPEVSEKVGYRDVKFFTSLFKRVTGSTPASFKKMHNIFKK